MTEPARRYSQLSILLHWAMLLLIAATYAAIELRELFPRGSPPREAFKSWHYMLGLTVLALVWVRILARLVGGTPPITPRPPAWQILASRAVHLALYGLMLAMPVAGWAILSAEGKPIPWFGLELPPLLAPDKALAARIEEVHETVGTIGYWLIGLHAAAALAHHHFWKDDTLQRMLPWTAARR